MQLGHGKKKAGLYYRARGAAKRAILKAKDAERKRFCEDLEGEDGKGNVFRLSKQLVSKTEMW